MRILNWRRISCASLILSLLPLVGVTAASANVAVTQQAVLVGQRPVSGRYEVAFKNYGQALTRCAGYSTQYHCWHLGFRAAGGEFRTSMNAFRIKEGLTNYDFYLLDADIVVGDHSGTDRGGRAKIYVSTGNATLVDFYDSKSLKATQSSCHKVNVAMSTPWPWVSASADLGTVSFCDSNASLTVARDGKTAIWTANRIAKINHITVNRVVKVPRGQKPTFNVKVVVPTDTCSHYMNDSQYGRICYTYTNGSATRRYSVTTTG